MKDYYKILGLRKDASPQDIKEAFRKLAKLYHPDKNSMEGAAYYFAQIFEAYQVLSDPSQKELYDSYLLAVYTKLLQNSNIVDNRNLNIRRNPMSKAERLRFEKQVAKERYKFYDKHLKKSRWVSFVFLIFTFLVILDFFLPYEILHETILERTNKVYTESCVFPILEDGLSNMLVPNKDVVIERTSIFKTEIKLIASANVRSFVFSPSYSIYGNLMFLIIVFILTSTLGVFWQNDSYFTVSLAYVNFIWFFIVFFLM